MKLPRDLCLGLAGMLGGTVLYLVARGIQDWPFDTLGASFFPKLASLLIGVFGLMLFITSLPEIKTPSPPKPSAGSSNTLNINLLFMACLICYVILLPVAGFIYASIALILIMYFTITKKFDLRELIKGISYATFSVLLVWLVFTKEFELILP